MNWIKRPTVSGFYWTCGPREEATLCEVDIRDDGDFSVMYIGDREPVYAREYVDGTLWFGPLTPPSEAAP